MGNNKAIPYYCHDCRVMFTIYFTPTRGRNTIFCPKCGDNVSTKRNPYTTGKSPDRVMKPRWTDEEKAKLHELFNGSNMTCAEIGVKLGKTEKSVRRMLERLNKSNLV